MYYWNYNAFIWPKSFIVNALVLLTKKFFNLVRGITRSRNIYRVMARMQTNQMKAIYTNDLPRACNSFDWLVSAVFHGKLTPIVSCQRVPG